MPKSSDKIKYSDLMLGEKAVEMYKKGKSIEEIAKQSPVYLNTKPVFLDLNTTDLAIAATLAGLNQIYVGDSGTGKSQLAQDIYNHYFGGNKKDGGEAVKVRGYKLADNTLDELVFQELNLEKARWDLTENVDACLYLVDEINRAPTIRQNDCFELGDGILNNNGKDIRFGRDGYTLMIATANLGNGDFQGTFEIDKAMYNRLGVAIDFDYKGFQPTFSDQEFLDVVREANPNIKESPKGNLVDKIINASKEISRSSADLGLEAKGVMQFLKYSLNNCSKGKSGELIEKNQKWHIQDQHCQPCSLNTGAPANFSLCSSIKSPVRRTLESTRKYSAALDFLAKLKGAKGINAKDVMFKAFELTGAYQNLLNPSQLKTKYFLENPEMMKDVVEKLKTEYTKNEDRILDTLEAAEKGMNPSSLFYIRMPKEKEQKIRDDYSEFEDPDFQKSIKEQGGEVSRAPFEFNDQEELGYSWVTKSAEGIAENKKLQEKNGKKNDANKKEE
jgi:hypothetical protein